jgi:hypothetical protein
MPLVTCPHCDHEQLVRRELDGLLIPCEKCREEFRVQEGVGRVMRSPRSRSGSVPGWVWVAICGGVAVVSIAGLLIVLSTRHPSPSRQGDTWNHAELLDHLNANGLSLSMVASKDGGAFFVDRTVYPAGYPADLLDEGLIEDKGIVFVYKHLTAQGAHDASGTRPERSFAWGRFRFYTRDGGLLGRLRDELGG